MNASWGEAPEGWEWRNLDELAEVSLGKTPKKEDYSDSGIKILKFRDIREVGIDWENPDRGYVPEGLVEEKRLRPVTSGTTLITASAHSPEQIGRKVAHVAELPDGLENALYTGELLAIRSRDEEVMASAWPFVFFRSELGYRVIQDAVRGGHLTNGRAREMSILLPPPEFHARIIEWLQEISRLREMTLRQMRLLGQAERSLTSGLFSGELTIP